MKDMVLKGISLFLIMAFCFSLGAFLTKHALAQSMQSNEVRTRVGTPIELGEPFTPLPGCVAAKTAVPLLDEKTYPRPDSFGSPTTCGSTSAAMVLQSLGFNTTIQEVTDSWERDGTWNPAGGFRGGQIPASLERQFPGQIQAKYHRVSSTEDVKRLIEETGNAVIVSAFYNNNAVGQSLDKRQTAGVAGNTNGGISLSNSGIGHMIVVYQVCSDRVYINDPIFAEQYSVPTTQFNTAITQSNRGEAITMAKLRSLPSTAQLANPTSGTISLCFGAIEPPYSSTNPHRGIDIAGSPGTQIYSAELGEVAEVSYDSYNGNYIRINHAQLGIQTSYLHLTSAVLVSRGQRVARGEHLAFMDSTGMSTGPHLHFGLRRIGEDAFIDPAPFLGMTCQVGRSL